MRLGPDEKVSVNVEADVATNMHQEMSAAGVVAATAERSAGVVGLVEAQVFATDAGHRVRSKFLAEARTEQSVEVIKNRPEWNVAEGGRIEILPRPPGHLAIEAEVLLHENIGAHAWVKAAAD